MSKFILLGNILSRIVGKVARLRVPILGPGLNRLFVKIFGINMVEAEKSLNQYRTIEDVFTRGLKPGARPIQLPVCVPADGTWSQAGTITDGMALQVKGIQYSAHELIGSLDGSENLAYFATVYLAPHNYHRVHSPIAGKLTAATYIPGALWPVNEPFVNRLPKLFNRNERLVFELEHASGGMVYVAMVGALNVGRIRTPFLPDFHSNDRSAPLERTRFTIATKPSLAAGDELGTFMLGSTAVLIFDQIAAEALQPLGHLHRKRPVRMGEALKP